MNAGTMNDVQACMTRVRAGPCSSRGVRPRRVQAVRCLPLLALLVVVIGCSGGSGSKATGATPVAPIDAVAVTVAPTARPASSGELGAPGPFAVGALRRTFTRTSSTTGQPRALETTIWYPAGDDVRGQATDTTTQAVLDAPVANGRFPVVMFSHGSGGYPEQSTYLTAHLASWGFVVLAPPHPGNTVRDCAPCLDQAALYDSAVNRPADVSHVIDQLAELDADPGSPLRGRLDGDRLGVAGHSFGGMTTVFAGSTDRRVRALLPLAPAVFPEVITAAARLTAPTLIIAGDRDVTTPVGTARQLYAALPEDLARGLLVLERGGHFSFSDVCIPLFPGCFRNDMAPARAHELINRYAAAFFLHYLNGDAAAGALLDPAAAPDDVTATANGLP